MHFADSVTRQRAPVITGPYGNQGRDWTATASVVYPAEVQPLSTVEDVVNTQRTQTRWRVWLPPTADVEATDRVVWDGDTYEVEGDVERWKRRGALHHLRAILVRVDQGA